MRNSIKKVVIIFFIFPCLLNNVIAGKVSLKVYDNQGRFVRSLLGNTMHAGKHELSWDRRNNQGESVSTGVYFYTIKSASFSKTKKMILIR